MPALSEISTSGFTFKVVFLDEDERMIDQSNIDILVPATDDREDDRDQAYNQADEEAEGLLEEHAADSFEISLVDAY